MLRSSRISPSCPRGPGNNCAKSLPLCALAVVFCGLAAAESQANTGTFIDRQRSIDLRVVSYNVLFDTIFPDENAVQAAKFERVVQALDPDVLNLQEVLRSAGDVVDLLNDVAPLPGDASWYAIKGGDNIVASKYPIPQSATNTVPPKDPTGIALIDLPDGRFDEDLMVMNNHFSCCTEMNPPDPFDAQEESRQREADALVNWMRDGRTPGEVYDLPQNTAMLVVGDLNIVMDPDVYDPLGTLLSGDIYFEEDFGSDSPPDWDGTPLADAHPLHNVTGPNDYTWRDDDSDFDPGRLDYVLYTDSILKEANKFVLNTVEMSDPDLVAAGLERYDIVIDKSPLTPLRYDHLPIVVDFRQVPEPASLVYAFIALACVVSRLRRKP